MISIERDLVSAAESERRRVTCAGEFDGLRDNAVFVLLEDGDRSLGA